MSILITNKPGAISTGTGAIFASSQVTTKSSAVSTSTFTTFSNSPALTFTPTITGTYKVYSSAFLKEDPASGSNQTLDLIRVFNTTGSATLLQESQGALQGIGVFNTFDVGSSIFVQSTYTLTAGTNYVFDLQGSNQTGPACYLDGSTAPFYMFAELIPVSGSVGTPTVNGHSFITTGTTFTTPSNVTAATNFKFTLVGGGGGGGASPATSNSSGTGGGGGGCGVLYATGISPSTALAIAIGSAGSAGVASSGGGGGNTTITISSVTYTAIGGSGGSNGGSTAAGGAGGATSGAFTIPISGESGMPGPSGSGVSSGAGGSSGQAFGMGAAGASSAGTTPSAGTGFGGAGAGGKAPSSATSQPGSAGTQGCILVEWWT